MSQGKSTGPLLQRHSLNTQMQSMERPEQVNKLSPNDLKQRKRGQKERNLEKKGNATGVVELVILYRTRAIQH